MDGEQKGGIRATQQGGGKDSVEAEGEARLPWLEVAIARWQPSVGGLILGRLLVRKLASWLGSATRRLRPAPGPPVP